VGSSPDGAIDDARLHEFVNGKLETKPTFRYEERLFDGQHIAVISIPQQQRPFYLKKDYGKLTKDTVYVRRGSATGIASPRKIAMMGAANLARGEAKVQLLFQTPENHSLPHSFEREFLNFPADLPDHAIASGDMFSISYQPVNKDYLREVAYYHSSWKRVIQVRLSLTNLSDFSLSDTHVEMLCRCTEGEYVSLIRADHMPEEPYSSGLDHLVSIPSMIKRANEQVNVDERGCEPVAHVTIGTVRPGQTTRAEEDLAILPSGPGNYVIQVRILANEIPTPLLIEHSFDVAGPVTLGGVSVCVEVCFIRRERRWSLSASCCQRDSSCQGWHVCAWRSPVFLVGEWYLQEDSLSILTVRSWPVEAARIRPPLLLLCLCLFSHLQGIIYLYPKVSDSTFQLSMT